MSAKITIVQSYVPAYRVGFFEGLRKELAERDIECTIAAGSPLAGQAKRGDSVERDWILPIDRKTVSFRGRSVKLAIHPAPWKKADAVILGLEGSSIPVYEALVSKSIRGVRVGLWGHAKPYVHPGSRIDLALEKIQMTLADHVFAYTPGGAKYVADQGVHPEKITTVMNTIDTSQLRQDLASISDASANLFCEKLGIDAERTICFVGGLDKSKRVNFLARSLDVLWSIDPTIRLLVGGKGHDEQLLRQAYSRKQALPLGYLTGHAKAMVLKTSRAVCMPGRIGLVAVDALVAGRPVLTTDWPYHAPEAEYLVEGHSRFTSENDPVSFAKQLKNFVDTQRIESQFNYPTMDQMVRNYAAGVARMLSS